MIYRVDMQKEKSYAMSYLSCDDHAIGRLSSIYLFFNYSGKCDSKTTDKKINSGVSTTNMAQKTIMHYY